MKRHWMVSIRPRMHSIRLILLLLALLLLGGTILLAQGGYDLTWWTVDDGGGASTGGTYKMSGTLGQPDAGAMSGGAYRLGGGFWGGGNLAKTDAFIYMPVVAKSD